MHPLTLNAVLMPAGCKLTLQACSGKSMRESKIYYHWRWKNPEEKFKHFFKDVNHIVESCRHRPVKEDLKLK